MFIEEEGIKYKSEQATPSFHGFLFLLGKKSDRDLGLSRGPCIISLPIRLQLRPSAQPPTVQSTGLQPLKQQAASRHWGPYIHGSDWAMPPLSFYPSLRSQLKHHFLSEVFPDFFPIFVCLFSGKDLIYRLDIC